MIELCPFCNSDAVIGEFEVEVTCRYSETLYMPYCSNDDCIASNLALAGEYGYDTEQEAIEAWNNRLKK